jgi:hypothetical protein
MCAVSSPRAVIESAAARRWLDLNPDAGEDAARPSEPADST